MADAKRYIAEQLAETQDVRGMVIRTIRLIYEEPVMKPIEVKARRRPPLKDTDAGYKEWENRPGWSNVYGGWKATRSGVAGVEFKTLYDSDARTIFKLNQETVYKGPVIVEEKPKPRSLEPHLALHRNQK